MCLNCCIQILEKNTFIFTSPKSSNPVAERVGWEPFRQTKQATALGGLASGDGVDGVGGWGWGRGWGRG